MITFGFGVHIHQPIGNFDSVLEEVYQKAYLPFLKLISRFPNIKVNYHISGCLLEWMVEHHPEFVDGLKELVKKEQLEILTSGFYEPILTLLPETDRVDQIKWYTDYLERLFGVQPKGLWLSERVWEQHLTKSLVKAGIKYTVVDDTHFKYSGLSEEELFGYFVTEEESKTLAIFPVSKKLRYFVPFQPVKKTIQFLKDDMTKGAERLRLLFDDGEKFGSWPRTNKHCYEDGWLKDFSTNLAQSDFIRTTLLSKYLESNPPLGRIYLDNASYEEMDEWVLSPKAFAQYEKLKKNYPANDNFLRSGFFRNYLVKYPEANRLHKLMIYVSKKITKSKSEAKKEARTELFRGQCNDAYWHGIFGGLYLPHLRNAVYQHLLQADTLISKERESKAILYDFDACGRDEIVFDHKDLFLVIAPDFGGTILCLDLRKFGMNLFDIIGRHQESYHQKIKSKVKTKSHSGEPVQSIHSELKIKDADIDRYLIYDSYQRLALLDHFLSPDVKVEQFYNNHFHEVYNVLLQKRRHSFNYESATLSLEGFCGNHSGNLTKTLSLSSNRIRFSYNLRQIPVSSSKPVRFGVEFGFRQLSRLVIGSQKIEPEKIGETARIKECIISSLRPEAEIKLNSLLAPFDLWYFPIHSISSSESGLERIYQGTVILLSWLLDKPDENLEFELGW
jgi:alpha-amylase